MAAVMANIALLQKGQLAYDPFLGTGGLAIAASAVGAFALGGDIDGYQLLGQGNAKNTQITDNIVQYDLASLYLGSLMADTAHPPFRHIPFLDAIVTDRIFVSLHHFTNKNNNYKKIKNKD